MHPPLRCRIRTWACGAGRVSPAPIEQYAYWDIIQDSRVNTWDIIELQDDNPPAPPAAWIHNLHYNCGGYRPGRRRRGPASPTFRVEVQRTTPTAHLPSKLATAPTHTGTLTITFSPREKWDIDNKTPDPEHVYGTEVYLLEKTVPPFSEHTRKSLTDNLNRERHHFIDDDPREQRAIEDFLQIVEDAKQKVLDTEHWDSDRIENILSKRDRHVWNVDERKWESQTALGAFGD